MNRNRTTREILIVALVVVGVLLIISRKADADFFFGQAQNSGPVINTSRHEIEPNPEPLLLWFARRNASDEWEEWIVSRTAEDTPWENPVNLGPWEESDWNLLKSTPSHTTADGLELYYYASEERRPEGYGGFDLWTKKREKIDDDWGPRMNLGPTVNSTYDEALPAVSPDGLELYFSGWNRNNARPGGYGRADLWVTRRNTRDDSWGEPVNLGPIVNTSSFDARPILVADGLLLFYESERSGGFGSADLYMMRRATVSDPWTEPVNLGPRVNGPASDEQAFLSPDGSTVYFHSDRPGGHGGYDIWQAPILPIIDFNGDGIVDSADMRIMIDHWGENYSSCDIGPTSVGDGIIDVQDLIVLAEHLFEDVNDPTLVAHWALDEIEGMEARDSVSGNSDFVMGDPLWQPTGGRVDGALELDGINDCIIASTYPNPTEGPFSVVAWIKGGESGQAIISQPNGVNWLAMDTEGKLMTELKGSGLSATALLSQALITDDQWHHIGLVWDGSQRMLCVDGVVVAEDTQDGLGVSTSGLYIGVGKNYGTGTFFAGLIDDVRIYNRVLIP